jgi:hypothetical protein
VCCSRLGAARRRRNRGDVSVSCVTERRPKVGCTAKRGDGGGDGQPPAGSDRRESIRVRAARIPEGAQVCRQTVVRRRRYSSETHKHTADPPRRWRSITAGGQLRAHTHNTRANERRQQQVPARRRRLSLVLVVSRLARPRLSVVVLALIMFRSVAFAPWLLVVVGRERTTIGASSAFRRRREGGARAAGQRTLELYCVIVRIVHYLRRGGRRRRQVRSIVASRRRRRRDRRESAS